MQNNNGFDDFDGIDLDSEFDDSGFGGGPGFGNDTGFGGGMDDFANGGQMDMGDMGGLDGFDTNNPNSANGFDAGGMGNDQGDFSGAFDDPNNDDFDNGNDGQAPQGTNKTYMIIAAAGIVLLVIVLIVAGKISKHRRESEALNQVGNQSQIEQSNNVNVDDIMGSGNRNNENKQSSSKDNETTVNYIKDENGFSWIEVTDSESVDFPGSYTDMTFTVTSVKHYARSVDANNNLVIKTTIQGSISGLSGTYTLDIPYEKGVKLSVGNQFAVSVQMGTYNGKTIIGDITY